MKLPWLSFQSKADAYILQEQTEAFSSLNLNHHQRPIFVTICGKKNKRSVVKSPTLSSNAALKQSIHFISFFQDDQSGENEYPLVLFDCDIDSSNGIIKSDLGATTHMRDFSFPNPDGRRLMSVDLKKKLCTKVLTPFSHVVCYFANDLGGVRGVAYLMAEYANTAQPSDLPSSALPHVLVVFKATSRSLDPGLAEANLLERIKNAMLSRKCSDGSERNLTEADIDASFRSISVLELQGHRDQLSGSRAFQRRLNSLVEDAHSARRSMQDPWTFQFVPPTAGARILSLDGGGIRGVVPLVYLRKIEEHISGFGAPIQDYFDLVCGTSAGGLIIMGLFLMQWSSEQCLQQFEELAAQTFKRRRYNSGIFTRMQELVLSYLNDCRYSSEAIEKAFYASFGTSPTMFNPLRRDTKVAVTTTTARDVVPCIFSNYNGTERPKQIGKLDLV
ncbi:MAG: hypothetical protein Q9157_002776 [Trypethelium eluteriae]